MEKTDLESQQSKTKDVVEAVKALVQEVPIYQDTIQPAAKEIGKGLETIAKTIHIALAPISVMVWSYDQIKSYLELKLSQKLEKIPPENIITPQAEVVGPAIEALRFVGNNEDLSEMFANLIANSMNKETTKNSHPAFVEILKNISGDEALIIKLFQGGKSYPAIDLRMKFKEKGGHKIVADNLSELGTLANCKVPFLTQTYVQNLCRLGIVEIPHGLSFVDKDKYNTILNSTVYLETIEKLKSESIIIEPVLRIIQPTTFGELFIKACVVNN